MSGKRQIVLSIAGFDPSGGAGVLADIKTIEQHQVQGMAVITANTIQTANDFIKLEWQDMKEVLKGIETLMNKYAINVIKIGIVPDFNFLESIIKTITINNPYAFIIWDPIIKSSSGYQFFVEKDLQYLHQIAGNIDLITPNYIEYALLKEHLCSDHRNAVLLKGGHRETLKGVDILMQGNKETAMYSSEKNVFQKHGSGCVLSSAIAANIALGKPLVVACHLGKLYVEQFLNSNPTLLGYHNNA